MHDTYNYRHFRIDPDAAQLAGPNVGERFIDVPVWDLHGRRRMLSEFVGKGRPVVLETGSLTCPIFVSNIPNGNQLVRSHPDIDWFVLYTREAHPGGRMDQVNSLNEKIGRARLLRDKEPERRAILIDGVDGAAHRAYGAMPNFMYLFDRHGQVRLRDSWMNHEQIEQALAHPLVTRPSYQTVPPRMPGSLTMVRVLARGGVRAFTDMLRAQGDMRVETARAKHTGALDASQPRSSREDSELS